MGPQIERRANNPYAWQAPDSLARLLNIPLRQVWADVRSGKIERYVIGDETFCRVPGTGEAVSRRRFSTTRNQLKELTAQIAALQQEVLEARAEDPDPAEGLREDKVAAEARAQYQEQLALQALEQLEREQGVADRERLDRERTEATLRAVLERLEKERHRSARLEQTAHMPWHAFRKKRRLIDRALQTIENLPMEPVALLEHRVRKS